jgi:hypothetical protein
MLAIGLQAAAPAAVTGIALHTALHVLHHHHHHHHDHQITRSSHSISACASSISAGLAQFPASELKNRYILVGSTALLAAQNESAVVRQASRHAQHRSST